MKAVLLTVPSLLMTARLHVLVDPASPWAQRLGWTLLHSLWQVALITLLAKLMFVVTRHRSAQTRYVAGVICLGMTLVLPLMTWQRMAITDGAALAVVTSQSDRGQVSVAFHEIARPVTLRNHSDQASVTSGPPTLMGSVDSSDGNMITPPKGLGPWVDSVHQILRPWLGVVVSIWIVGVLLAMVRPIVGLCMQWRLQHYGLMTVPDRLQQQLQMLSRRLGIGVAVRIAESTLVSVPMVVGYLQPIVLLPASVLTGLTPAQLESLLAHELAHVRRHDWIVNALQIVIESLLFFHPAVWWLSSQVRNERELCCDDLALSVVNDKLTYGRMLLTLEELRQPVTLAGLSATGGDLSVRIRRLLSARAVEQSGGRGRLAGVVMLGLLAATFVVIPALGPVDAEQQLPTVKPTVEHVEPVVNRAGTDVMRIGSVLRNRDNIPIAGADVILSLENTVDGQNQTHFVAAATTNALGKYSLGVPEEYRKYCLPNTKLIVWALANSYGVTIVKIGAGSELAETAPPVRAQTVTVKVSDAQGRPVAGHVTRMDLSGLQIPPQFLKRMISPRDDGLIDIRHMPMPDEDEHDLDQRTLWLQTKDLGLQSFHWGTYLPNIREGERPVELTAQPLGTIRGQFVAVVAVNGQFPAEVLRQAQIEIETFNGDSSFKTPWVLGYATTATAADGQFELRVAGGKLTRIRARLPEGSRWKALLENRDSTFVPPGETLAINVPLVATRRMRGVVLQADGKGFPGIEFNVSHGDLQTSQLDNDRRSTTSAYNEFVVTDANGQFAIDVIPGDVSLTWQFDPGGRVGTSELWPDRDVSPINMKAVGPIVVPRGQDDFEIPAITLTPYAGKLLDEVGQPMEGVLRAGGTGRGMTRTNRDGTFSMNVLGTPTEWLASRVGETADFGLPRPDAPNVKVVSHSPLILQVASAGEPVDGPADGKDAKPAAAPPAAPAEAKLSWSATGRVLDGAGKPVEGALVYASTGMGSLFTTGSALTDAEGRYDFQFGPGISIANDDVQLQFATISVSKPGFFEKNLSRQGDLLLARKFPKKLTWERRTNADIILPGQPRKLDFVLLPAARLAGTLLDESEKPLVGYGVALTGKDLPPSASVIGSTKTDDKGHFELTEIPTTFKYQILIEPEKREPPWNAWASGPYEFRLSRGDEFFIQQADREVEANRFEIKLKGSGINWREALQRGTVLEKLEPHGDYLTGKARLHAAVLRLTLSSEAPPPAKPDAGSELLRRN